MAELTPAQRAELRRRLTEDATRDLRHHEWHEGRLGRYLSGLPATVQRRVARGLAFLGALWRRIQ